jgi:hypothetical protein
MGAFLQTLFLVRLRTRAHTYTQDHSKSLPPLPTPPKANDINGLGAGGFSIFREAWEGFSLVIIIFNACSVR